MQPLPTEIMVLGLSVVLLLVQLFMASIPTTVELGGKYQAGPRDQPRSVNSVFAGRAARAFRNLLETYPVFVALALALTVTGRSGGWGALGAEIWLVMRLLYVPAYLVHFPFVRSLLWFVSVLALLAMLARLFNPSL
jgi:uncharacterized MAPEG superfamily protein